jgi:putative DNA primase/helicase
MADDFGGNIDNADLVDEDRRQALWDAAYFYVKEKGWRVIPVHDVGSGRCSCGDAGCSSPGKHPVEQQWQKPGENPEEDLRWWRDTRGLPLTAQADSRPNANIGILTGKHSGIFVPDIDPRNGGDLLWEKITDGRPLPETRMHRTGSDGRHWFFTMPGFDFTTLHPWGEGIDVKGNAGYVVAPPSISGTPHGDGVYAVISDAAVAPAPDWMIEAIQDQKKVHRGERPLMPVKVAPNGVRRAYGERALRDEAASLAAIPPEGGRHLQMKKGVQNLGQLGAVGLVTEEAARAAMRAATGLPDGEFNSLFDDMWRIGMTQPRQVDWKQQEGDFPPRAWSDRGLADRLADHWGDVLRLCPGLGWMIYDGSIWERDVPKSDEASKAEMLAQMMLDSLPDVEGPQYPDEADEEEDGKGGSPRARFLEQCRKWESVDTPTKAVRSATRLPVMWMNPKSLDVNPMFINLANGVWDADNCRLLDHHPGHMLTKQASVFYEQHAKCPDWDDFLAQVQPDPEIRDYLYRIWGYSLTGSVREQAIILHHGKGANGKSVANDVISMMMGAYAQSVPVETLIASRGDKGVRNDIARMEGARLLQASETKAGKQLDEALVKQLTGGETVAARFLHKEFIEFKMTGKIHLSSNHLVHLSQDPAIWRRIRLIKWPVTIPDGKQDKQLAAKLYKEAPGILNRLLAGLEDWRASGGLCPPKSAEDAKDDYRNAEDALGRAIAELYDVDMTVTEPHPDSKGSILAKLYAAWCKEGEETPMGRNSFYAALTDRDFKRVEVKESPYFPQLRPKTESIEIRH